MVQGIPQLRRRLAKVPQNVIREVEAQIAKSAEEIVREMRMLAPVRTGSLALSIGWTWGAAPKGAVTVGKSKGRNSAGIRATIYAGGGDQFYARFQEFGTVRMPANPFFFPVYRANRRRARGRITRAVKRAAKKS